MKEIRDQLLLIRQRLQLSQEELASRLGVSFATVNRWENGKTSFTARAKVKIRALYDRVVNQDEGMVEAMGSERRKRGIPENSILNQRSMEQMLWRAACSIRGEKDAPRFKDYILPLLFIKRLSDVFDDELQDLTEKFGNRQVALDMLESDPSIVRFYIPPEARWSVVSGREDFHWPSGKKPHSLGEQLTSTMRAIVRANSGRGLEGVIDLVDYNATHQGVRDINDKALRGVIEAFSKPEYRLGLCDVEPDFLGRAYEYLLRKFAEGQGQSAGEFFTPREVGFIMSKILRPKGGETAHDYACGSFGLLVKLHLVFKQNDRLSRSRLKLFGQELNKDNFALGCMNKIIHDVDGEIRRGDSMRTPKFTQGGRLKTYDIVIANPMWNQPFEKSIYDNDSFDRFDRCGGPTSGKGDWAWLQHSLACLNARGRAAIILDTGAVTRGSRGSVGDREKKIRKWFVEKDVIEGVILFPENLFYNTSAAGIIIFLNKNKPQNRKGRIILLNASLEFYKGQPKNHISDESIDKIVQAFIKGEDQDKFVKVIDREEARKNDYNLSPSMYVNLAETEVYRDVPEILDELKGLQSESRVLDQQMGKTLSAVFKSNRK